MPSIFISTAHKNPNDEQIGTGDVDYAHTLAERLKEFYQTSQCGEEVDCIQHLHDESAIYKYIEEKKSKNPILHIMLNPPYTGSAFTVDGLLKFKERNNCKIIVTSIEFAKYDVTSKSEALSYFNIADHIIFLDEQDKEQAEKFSNLNSICNSSVIPVPATIPEIPGLKPSAERGNNILFFGMIRKAKGIGYLLQLAHLIQKTKEDSIGHVADIMRDIKIIIVGSIQEHIYDNIFQLKRIILEIYPEKKEHIEKLININGNVRLSSEEIKNIIQRLKRELKSYEEQNLPKALPIELYLDVPKDQLAVPFNKCKFSVLPLWRGGSIRNSSMTNMLVHDFITISFSGSATPEILIRGEYNGAMVLLPQKNAENKDVFANNVFDAIKSRLEEPELNNVIYDKMRSLSKHVLSIEITIQKHADIYSYLRDYNEYKFNELNFYEPVYSTYGIQFIKTIRSDVSDYYDKFVGAILGEHKEPLRRAKRAQEIYKIGIRDKEVQVLKADECGKFLPPQFSAEEKQGKSKKMSLTVISSKQQYLTSLFGQNTEGRTTGIILFTESGGESDHDKQIILPSLMFKHDSGTVGRTFYFETEENAHDYIQNKGLYITVQQLINTELENHNTCYNEVLGRLQWLPNDPRCHIGIFSNDLKAKLLAQLRAIDLKINTNANYIPITFYDKGNKDLPFRGYLLEERQADVDAGLLLSADNDENNIINAMALLIKKYDESPLLDGIVWDDETREKCLTVLMNFKFTKITIIKFIKLMFANVWGSDVNLNISAACDQLLTLVNKNVNYNITVVSLVIIHLLEKIENINDESVIKKFCELFDKVSSNNQEKISFLGKILQKIIDLSPESVRLLLEGVPYKANEDAKLEYLKSILEKITDFSPEIIKLLLKAVPSNTNEDAQIEYLKNILGKITDFSPEIIKLLLEGVPYKANEDAKLEYLKNILGKITDFSPEIIKLLLKAVPYKANEDAKLEYLKNILGKITDFSPEIIKLLLEGVQYKANEDAKLDYLKSISGKITDFSPEIIKLLLESVQYKANEDAKLDYLKSILGKITDFSPEIIKLLLKAIPYNASEDTNLEYLKSIVEKITDVGSESVKLLLKAVPYKANEDAKLDYLKSILGKITDFSPEIIKLLLKAVPYNASEDTKLEYLKSIVGKTIDFSAESVKLWLERVPRYANENAKLEYLKSILGKITDFSSELIKLLLEAVPSNANGDAQIEYLKSILEKITDFSPEIIKLLLKAVPYKANEDAKLEYLKNILGKITDFSPEIIKLLLEAVSSNANEDTKLDYLKNILGKITDFSPEIIKLLLKAVPYNANEDAQIEYLKSISGKITDFSPEIIKLLLEAVPSNANEDAKLDYLKSILEKTTDLSSGVIQELLRVTYFFNNSDAQIEYLKNILGKITDFSPEIIKLLLEGVPYKANEDAKLDYLKSILEKTTDLSSGVIQKLLQVTYLFNNSDVQIEYLKSILEKTTDLSLDVIKRLVNVTGLLDCEDVEKLNYLEEVLNKIMSLNPIGIYDEIIKIFIFRLCSLNLEPENSMKMLSRFKLGDDRLIKVINIIKEESTNIMNEEYKQKLQNFLNTISTNLITKKLAFSPLLITVAPVRLSSNNIEEDIANNEPPAKRPKY